MRQINIGLLGCGTVGTGVAKLLLENQKLLTQALWQALWQAEWQSQAEWQAE